MQSVSLKFTLLYLIYRGENAIIYPVNIQKTNAEKHIYFIFLNLTRNLVHVYDEAGHFSRSVTLQNANVRTHNKRAESKVIYTTNHLHLNYATQ